MSLSASAINDASQNNVQPDDTQSNSANLTSLRFSSIVLTGDDASSFLQGQLTCDVSKLEKTQPEYQATAIANLKGRVAFGLWIKWIKLDTGDAHGYELVVSQDCVQALVAHIKKYAAFSKVSVSEPASIYPCIQGEQNTQDLQGEADNETVLNSKVLNSATFSHNKEDDTSEQAANWAVTSIATGNYWITEATQSLFQPQALRLHQQGGVDYDKGCYLGQEVIARLYFKTSPKAYLHRVSGENLADYLPDDAPTDESQSSSSLPSRLGKHIQVVNLLLDSSTNRFEALVMARPEHVAESDLIILPLPPHLQADVARPQPQS